MTFVLRVTAMLTVTGTMQAIGRAKALISHVPPESILQGADAAKKRRSKILLTGVDVG